MYPEYDPNEQSLGQSFADILRGLKNPQAYQDAGRSLLNAVQLTPNVTESLGRGGVAQAIGTTGDLRDLRNTIQSYLPKSVQNFSNAAEFLTNPYAKALIQTAPTTEQTLDFVPRATAPYEGYKQHETLGEYIAPSLGYFGAKAFKATKDLPIGMTIQDVTPPIEPVKVADALRQPEKNSLGFYSPLDEAVMNLQNQKGTGQQYLAQLLKTQGVKQEEVATRGLDTFLENNPKVTREQMAQYLRENPVELKETVLGADTQRSNPNSMNIEEHRFNEPDILDDQDYINSVADDLYFEYKNDPSEIEHYRAKAHEDLGIDPKSADFDEINKVDELTDNYLRDAAEARAHDQYWESPTQRYTDDIGYEVTGNEDYGFRITDPNGHEVPVGNDGIYSIGNAQMAIRQDALERGFMHYPDDEVGTKYHDYTLPNGENYKEVLIQYEPKREPPKYDIRELPEEDKTFGKYFGVYEGDKLINTWHGSGNAEDWVRGQKENFKDYGNYESGHFDEPNILAHFRTTDRTIDGKKTLFVEEIQSDWHQAGRKKGYTKPVSEEKKMEIRLELDKIDRARKELYESRAKQVVAGQPVNESFDPTLAYLERQELELRNQLKGSTGVPDAPFKKNWQELAMKRAMQMAAEGGYDRVAFTTGKQQAERYNLSKQVDQINWMPYESNGSTKVVRIQPNNGNTIELRLSPEGAVMNGGQFEGKTIDEVIGKDIAKKIMDENTGDLSGVNLDIGGEGMKGFYDKILPDFINKYGKKHGLKVGQTSLSKFKSKNLFKPDQDTVHYFDLTPEAKESFLKKGQPMFAAAPAVALTDEDTRRETLEKLFNSKK